MAASTADQKSLPAKSKRPLFVSQGTVTIKVGPEERSFTVHRDLLRHQSPYFDGALGGGFKESKENLILLPEDNPDVFELFVNWLYAQRFNQENEENGLMIWRNLAELYVFADMRGVSLLKDALISVFVKRLKQRSAVDRHRVLLQLPYIYANTTAKCLLRKLLVDYVIFDAFKDSKLKKFKEHLTTEFLVEVIEQMKEKAGDRSSHAPYSQSTCKYHEHSIGQPCDT